MNEGLKEGCPAGLHAEEGGEQPEHHGGKIREAVAQPHYGWLQTSPPGSVSLNS